jgi:hypothetical protein
MLHCLAADACKFLCEVSAAVKKKNQIGDHALPQRGFGLSTPSGAGRKGATPSNARHRRQRESRKRAMHEPRSKHTRARRPSVIRHRSSNQENKGGKNGADSITTAAGAALQEGKRIQEPGQAVPANRVRIKGVHMERQTHTSGRLMRQEVPQVRPEAVQGIKTFKSLPEKH